MQKVLPDYILIAEILGFGTGTVLSVLLFLLVRRSAGRSPGTVLLTTSALLWNVFVFLCPVMPESGLARFTMHAVAWNAAVILTAGSLIQAKDRLKLASDRIYV